MTKLGPRGFATRPLGLVLNPHREGFSRFWIDALAGFRIIIPWSEYEPATQSGQFTALGHKCSFSTNSILDRGWNLVEECSIVGGFSPVSRREFITTGKASRSSTCARPARLPRPEREFPAKLRSLRTYVFASPGGNRSGEAEIPPVHGVSFLITRLFLGGRNINRLNHSFADGGTMDSSTMS